MCYVDICVKMNTENDGIKKLMPNAKKKRKRM